jgi:ribonuclease G
MVKQNEKKLAITLQPYLYAFFTKGIISRQVKWFFKYKRWITLVEDSSLAFTEYSILNAMGEEIEI